MVLALIQYCNPFHRPLPLSDMALQQSARINLGLVESAGMIMVSMWHYHTTLESCRSADLVPRLVIECSHGASQASPKIAQVGSNLTSAHSESDSMKDLENRRRSSPPRVRRRRRKRFVSVAKQAKSTSLRSFRPRQDSVGDRDMRHADSELEASDRGSPKQNGEASFREGNSSGDGDAQSIENESQEGHQSVGTDHNDKDRNLQPGRASVLASERPKHSKLEGQVVSEALTVSRLPWWIIGSTMTFPILAFILARSAPAAFTQWMYRAVHQVFLTLCLFLAWTCRYVRFAALVLWDRRYLVNLDISRLKRASIAVREYIIGAL